MLKKVTLRFILLLLLVASTFPIYETGKASGDDSYIIADHTVVDKYDDIPQQYIDDVKEMFLNVPGESHSAGYRIGLELLEQSDPTYQVINSGDNKPAASDNQALRVSRWVYDNGRAPKTGEQEWFTWHAWDPSDENYPQENADLIKNHITYCNNNNLNITAMGFGWCFDMTWPGVGGSSDNIDGVVFRWGGVSEDGPDGSDIWGLDDGDYALTGNHVNMDDYLQATEEYISHVQSQGYDTVVFFTTGPVDAGGEPPCPENSENGYQREIKHDYIRQYVIDHNKVLFDYADILAYNDDGVKNTNTWNGHTYPQIHPDNMKDLDGGPMVEDGDHIGEAGALRLGKALWWLLARLAGWGTTASDTQPPSVNVVSPNGGEKRKVGCQYDITWTATDDVDVTSCNISYSWDNGSNYIDVATGEVNDGTYSWTVPDTESVSCLVKVAAGDAAGNWGEDASDAVFEITASIPGDANDDGVVDALDITRIERIILELDPPTNDADANEDGNRDVLDITRTEQIIYAS